MKIVEIFEEYIIKIYEFVHNIKTIRRLLITP
jgi:hypothetical protein